MSLSSPSCSYLSLSSNKKKPQTTNFPLPLLSPNPSPPIRATRHLSSVAFTSASYPLTIFNRTPSKAHPLLSRRARHPDFPVALARSSDVVFLVIGYPSDVRHVILNPSSGVLSVAFPGSVIVDMTTSDSSLAREIGSAVSSSGSHSVDAPYPAGPATPPYPSSPATTKP